LGSTGLSVPRISLGCVTFGREIDQEQSFRIMDYAVEHGITLFDTAEAYGPAEARESRRKLTGVADDRGAKAESHASERIIGRWLKSRNCRKGVILQTKVSPPLTAEHIPEALTGSLERLQTDCVDIYMFHNSDSQTPMHQSLGAMAAMRSAGKIRFVGASNFSAEQLREAMGQVEAVQLIYNLAIRGIEADLLPLCRQQDVGVQTYSPLGAGFLTGKYTAGMQKLPEGSRFDLKPGHARIYFSEKNFRIVDRLRGMSQRTGLPMARLAMGWVLHRADVATVLVGARTTEHLHNALEAMEMEMAGEWVQEMDEWDLPIDC
jgi:aryl-alcohol dehydrogenase-like predicted oxidoreductase